MKNSINNILIFRQIVGPTWSRGQLYLNGEFIGYTLEDTIRPANIKVKHHTAIGGGVYYGRKFTSTTFGRCLAIDDVPMFEHIRIHGGNDHEDTSGCVLLGFNKNDKAGTISNCRPALELLLSKLDDSKPIVVSIANAVGIT